MILLQYSKMLKQKHFFSHGSNKLQIKHAFTGYDSTITKKKGKKIFMIVLRGNPLTYVYTEIFTTPRLYVDAIEHISKKLPTLSAAEFLGRIYYQFLLWMGTDGDNNPLNCG